MKNLFYIFIAILLGGNVSAQFDDRFYYPTKEWQKIDSLKYEEVLLLVDQDTVSSLLIKPEETPKATILFFHASVGNNSTWVKYIKPLVEDGFQVVMFDYRGYGKSTGKPTHLNIASDAQVFFDYIIKREDVKGTKLIVYGASIGTQVAVHLTKNNNDRITALILDGMMSSFTDLALAISPEEAHEVIKEYVTSPYSAIEDIRSITNTEMLFIHSEEDTIPIADARSVFDRAEVKKMFWIYEGNHLEAGSKHTKKWLEYINQLLN